MQAQVQNKPSHAAEIFWTCDFVLIESIVLITIFHGPLKRRLFDYIIYVLADIDRYLSTKVRFRYRIYYCSTTWIGVLGFAYS
jgi:hypothetical protein